MAKETKRINLTVSKEKYELIKTLASKRNKSMAQFVEDAMETGMELLEDLAMVDLMEERIEKKPDQLLEMDDLQN